MDHGPAVKVTEDSVVSEYKTRLGLRFFAVYGSLFAGFVGINTFFPQLMKVRVILGLNLAVTYGFLLILTAIVMGLIYNDLCTKRELEFEKSSASHEEVDS